MLDRLQRMADSYAKVKPQGLVGSVNLEIGGEKFHLTLEPEAVSVEEGHVDGALLDVVMDEKTWSRVSLGVWNGLTAGTRERADQPAPLDFRLPPGRRFEEVKELLYHLAMHFFKQRYPHVYRYGPSNARPVHGGLAVPLVYGHGVRFAYYALGPGEQLNEEDATNPFEQFFAVISGEGTAVVDGVEVPLEPGVAFHVPPGKTHIVRSDPTRGIELFWLGYGPGA